MNPCFVNHALSTVVVLLALLAQAWVAPVARISARACCCKPGEIEHASLWKARCCAAPKGARPVFKIEARTEQHDDARLLVAIVPGFVQAIPAPAIHSPAAAPERPPHLRIGRGLPYRLQV